MVMSVTFVVASKPNINGLLELCNDFLFLNGSGTRSKCTSSLVFLDHKRVMMPSLSSSTDSLRLLILFLSRRQSLLVSWQTCMFPESCPSTAFRWRLVQTVSVFSPQDSGIVSKKLWELT